MHEMVLRCYTPPREADSFLQADFGMKALMGSVGDEISWLELQKYKVPFST